MAIFTAVATALSAGISTFLAGGTIGASIAAGTAASALGAFVLKTAVGTALSFASQALMGKPKSPKAEQLGRRVGLASSPNQPRSYVLGRTAVEGSLVWWNVWGESGKTPNAYLTQVIALSDVPLGALLRIIVNDAYINTTLRVPPDPKGNAVREYQVKGKDHLWVKFHDGTQVTADPFLVNTASSAERPYESTRVGTGVAYVIVTMLVNQELFSGVPRFRFEVEGMDVYNPALDSTNGGTGSQRWNTPSTWDRSRNAAVAIYNVLRGVSYNGEWFHGGQTAGAARFDVIEAIADCESNGFDVGLEVPVNVPARDVLSELLTACGGRIGQGAGGYRLSVDLNASVASFTDGDIISDAPQSFTPFFGLADSINGIQASFSDPAQLYNQQSLKPRLSADFEEEDGGRRLLADIFFGAVSSGQQADKLSKRALAEARRARRHTFTLGCEFWGVEPGDVVTWTSVRNGYENKKFRVDGVMDLPDGFVIVDITEVDPSDYDYDPLVDYTPPVDGSIGINRPGAQTMPDFAVFADSIKDASGVGRRPAIRLEWDGDQPDVLAVDYQVRVTAVPTHYPTKGGLTLNDESSGQALLEITPGVPIEITPGVPIVFSTFEDIAAGVGWISDGIQSLTAYQVRARYVPTTPRAVDWSAWLPVTTGDFRFTADDLDPTLLATLTDATAQVEAALADAIDNLNITAEAVADLEAQIDAAQASADAQIATVTTTINGKTTTFRQASAPTATAIGDFWIKTSDGNKLFVATAVGASNWIEATDERIAEALTSISAETVLRVNEDIALAASIASVSASLTGTQATVTQTSAALADVEGNLSAAYLLRVGTGANSGSLEVVAWDNVDGGAGSNIKLNADYIDLAGKVVANSLLITGPRDNLNLDPIWEDPTFWGLTVTTSSSATAWVIQDAANEATRALKSRRYRLRSPTNPSTNRVLTGPLFAVEPLKSYQVSTYVRKYNSPDTVSGVMRVYWYTQSGAYIDYENIGSYVSSTAETLRREVVTAPSDAVTGRLGFVCLAGTGSMLFGLCEIKPQIDGATMITERSVVAENLIATEEVIAFEAQMGAATVGRLSVIGRAITSQSQAYTAGRTYANGSKNAWVTCQTLTVTREAGGEVMLVLSADYGSVEIWSSSGLVVRGLRCGFRLLRNGNVLRTWKNVNGVSDVVYESGLPASAGVFSASISDLAAPLGTLTYQLQVARLGNLFYANAPGNTSPWVFAENSNISVLQGYR